MNNETLRPIKMTKHLLAIIFIFISFCSSYGIPRAISEKSEFSLLTCSNGAEVYSIFGHSALRFKDDKNGIDIVYNYGLFSFDTESFLYKFVKGETDYLLGVEYFRSFKRGYVKEKRDVYEHVLQLSQEEKEALFLFLENNAKPENRIYRYNYMFDNCSSRLRDVLENILGDKLKWEGNNNYDKIMPRNIVGLPLINSYYSGNETPTFRDILDLYSKDFPWVDCGIYMPIGVPADKKATLRESMFIPDFLMNAFCHATVERNGIAEPLVKEFHVVLEYNVKEDVSMYTHPITLMWLIGLAIVAISVVGMRRKKHSFLLDGLLLGIVGFFGIVVWFVSCISVHPAVFFNFNLFWILPTHFLVAFLLKIKYIRKYIRIYMAISGIIAVVMIFFWFAFPQNLHLAHYPIVLALSVRLLKNAMFEENQI